MPRSGAAARERLREAALVLYAERGYDATTTAQIAEHAGVTERTYFRHFADKREVLFDGETELCTTMADAILDAPPGLPPLALVLRAYRAAIPLFVAGRPVAQRRSEIISTTPALQERAHAKAATLLNAITDALVTRGVGEPRARLAAQIGAAAFDRASRSWNHDPALALEDLLTTAAAEALQLVRAATDDSCGKAVPKFA